MNKSYQRFGVDHAIFKRIRFFRFVIAVTHAEQRIEIFTFGVYSYVFVMRRMAHKSRYYAAFLRCIQCSVYTLYVYGYAFYRRAGYAACQSLPVVLIIVNVERYVLNDRAVTYYSEQTVRSKGSVYGKTVTVKRSAETYAAVYILPTAFVFDVYPGSA